jgi:hypothetical protein
VLADAFARRTRGLRFYGLTPPKLGEDDEKVRATAARQMARIRGLAPDGVILYDLQDEAGRAGTARPFPFLPTLTPEGYAREFLADLDVPKIFYKCVGNGGAPALDAFAASLSPRDACVLVGAPSSSSAPAFTLRDAYARMAARHSDVCLGGVAIAERHARKGEEHERLAAKHASGVRFFVSQTVYDASATKSLLSDYALRFAREDLSPPPFILSFSPCGSVKTMEFMRWLGIDFPRWLENELRHTPRILEASVELALSVFDDIAVFADRKGVPIGVNVESVSIRREEIEASCDLFERLSRRLGAR